MKEGYESITHKYLPPPITGVEEVVLNKATGEVGFLYEDGHIDHWFPTEADARRELCPQVGKRPPRRT